MKQESEFKEVQSKGKEMMNLQQKGKFFEESGLSDGRLSHFLGKNSFS
ncbi:MAG: hypothetical protein ACW97P_11535 [Candidatus Hodarchaeales archaeon]|jgi:hypothetical protein